MDRKLIEHYAQGADQVAKAIAGLTAADLNALPVAGTWSIRQIVLHLMDSDLIASDRMKRVIAEDNPQIVAYDESAFARRLHYTELDAVAACEIFRLNRLLTSEILRRLPASDFQRFGTHSEKGKVTLTDLVKTYVEHLAHHLRFIEQKRKLLSTLNKVV